MKNLFILILLLGMTTGINAQTKTIYNFSFKDIKGNEFDLNQLKGKKVLIVNTASK